MNSTMLPRMALMVKVPRVNQKRQYPQISVMLWAKWFVGQEVNRANAPISSWEWRLLGGTGAKMRGGDDSQ